MGVTIVWGTGAAGARCAWTGRANTHSCGCGNTHTTKPCGEHGTDTHPPARQLRPEQLLIGGFSLGDPARTPPRLCRNPELWTLSV